MFIGFPPRFDVFRGIRSPWLLQRCPLPPCGSRTEYGSALVPMPWVRRRRRRTRCGSSSSSVASVEVGHPVAVHRLSLVSGEFVLHFLDDVEQWVVQVLGRIGHQKVTHVL